MNTKVFYEVHLNTISLMGLYCQMIEVGLRRLGRVGVYSKICLCTFAAVLEEDICALPKRELFDLMCFEIASSQYANKNPRQNFVCVGLNYYLCASYQPAGIEDIRQG